MNEIETLMEKILERGTLILLVISSKRKKSMPCKKVTLRPVKLNDRLMYQIEYSHTDKVYHENLPGNEALAKCLELITGSFKQMDIFTSESDIQVLASKATNPRITKKPPTKKQQVVSHNKTKQYIIPEGEPCDFLIELKVMSPAGDVYNKFYSKFKQINRYLEIIDDIYDKLPATQDRPLKLIDFGCGKAYLTFAVYYYFTVIKKRSVQIIGFDLKEDVIANCTSIAKKLNYDALIFQAGDIADCNERAADIVMSLHACDTATDLALIKAVQWGARVILSVPCCQHELFSQINDPVEEPMLKHGIIKDKFTELLTDGLRGLKLESVGYHVSMIEFTSLEHTSKNIMLRAVRSDNFDTKKARKAASEYEALKIRYHVTPSIDLLVKKL